MTDGTTGDDLVSTDGPAPSAGLVLAGGAGRRLGGVDKPGLIVGGATLLDRAVAALGDATVIVVGSRRAVLRPVRFVAEEPPGSGPAAAVHAGVRALAAFDGRATVALLAADLPAVSSDTVGRVLAALVGADGADGAVLADADDREQLLLSVWRLSALRTACHIRQSWAGAPLRALLAPLRRIPVAEVDGEGADIDTVAQWRRWSDE